VALAVCQLEQSIIILLLRLIFIIIITIINNSIINSIIISTSNGINDGRGMKTPTIMSPATSNLGSDRTRWPIMTIRSLPPPAATVRFFLFLPCPLV
jgi:hypothetical protein